MGSGFSKKTNWYTHYDIMTVKHYSADSSPKRDARDTGSCVSVLACFLNTISGRSKTTGLLYTSDIWPCDDEWSNSKSVTNYKVEGKGTANHKLHAG